MDERTADYNLPNQTLLTYLSELTADPSAPDIELLTEIGLSTGTALVRRGRLEEGTRSLAWAGANARTDALKAQIADQLLLVAKAWAKSGDFDAAEKSEWVLHAALELMPAQAAGSLAQFLQERERLPEAIEQRRNAIVLNPQESTNYLALARLYKRAGEAEKALAVCLDLINAAPSGKNTLVVAGLLDEIARQLPSAEPARTLKVALLGSATLNHLYSYLKVGLYRAGLRPDIYMGGFGQYAQEILDPKSALYSFAPDVLVLAIHPSQLFPNLHHFPFNMAVEQRRAEMDAGLEAMESLISTFAQRSSALVLVHNMVVPQHPALGILDLRDELGQVRIFSEINSRLAEMARDRFRNVYVVGEDAIQSRYGKAQATDPRLWLTARLPWSDGVLNALSHEYLRFIRPLKSLGRKCIVLDLDNTLWGGVIGEDGLSGIQLGSEAPGSAYVAFQRELELLWRRGILLAISSKNNPGDVMPVFDGHPYMVLKRSHFAAQRINWEPKEQNIREIASELNIGLDSIVFLDDNPMERARIRAELPSVLTPELPADPALYRSALLGLGVFDSLALTEEDINRNKLYTEQRDRQEYASTFSNATLDDYLSGLEMVVEIAPASSLTLPRIAQLTAKTNQFNLTTRRYSEAQIVEMEAQGSLVFGMSVTDRFGDNGLVGVAIVAPTSPDIWEIDTFLMSCRVMGRGVETALLTAISELLRARGAKHLEGWYIPTPKNAPVEDFYPRHGFEAHETKPDGSIQYRFDVQDGRLTVPTWFKVRVATTV